MTSYEYLILETSTETQDAKQMAHVKWRCEACVGEFPNVLHAVVTGSVYCDELAEPSLLLLDSMLNKAEIEQDLQSKVDAQAAEIAALKGQA
jgi:hypothetical protein